MYWISVLNLNCYLQLLTVMRCTLLSSRWRDFSFYIDLSTAIKLQKKKALESFGFLFNVQW